MIRVLKLQFFGVCEITFLKNGLAFACERNRNQELEDESITFELQINSKLFFFFCHLLTRGT